MKLKAGDLVSLWGRSERLGIVTKANFTTVDVYWFDIQRLTAKMSPHYLIVKVDENAV